MSETSEAVRDYTRGLVILAVLALVAFAAVVNPAPWSPMGKAEPGPSQRTESPTVDLKDFDIPKGWGPGDNGTRIVISSTPRRRT